MEKMKLMFYYLSVWACTQAWNHRRAVHKVQYRLLSMMRSLVEEVRSRYIHQATFIAN